MEPLPSSMTVAPILTFWSAPAFATGGVLVVVIVTVEGALSRKPLFTMSCATYVPGRSARKLGEATVVLDKVVVLPTGLLVMAHLNVSVSP